MIVSKRLPPKLNRFSDVLWFAICTLFLAVVFDSVSFAQTKSETLSPPDTITQRYWDILRSNPRPGTAFDQWYSGHVDRGEIQALTSSLKQQAESKTDDAKIQLLLGLVLRRQGELETATNVFQRAAAAAKTDYYPQLLLGQTLQQAQDFAGSSKALSAAIALASKSRIPRSELLSLYRDLGQAQGLAGNPDAAVATWTKLGELFPSDQRVQTQIARWLQNDNRLPEALVVWKRVERLTKDPYAKLESRLAMCDIYAELNNRPAAVAILDDALDNVKPGSSLERDVRSRLTVVHGSDADALIRFLSKRVETHPDEIGSTVQLSEAFHAESRYDEAIVLLRAAIKRAPKQNDVREALIVTLQRTKQFDKAYQHADILVRQNPQDVEFLRLAGQLRLDAAKRPAPNAVVQEVLEIWNRIPRVRPNDASLAIRTGDMFAKSAGLNTSISTTFSPDALRKRYENNPFIKAAERSYRRAVEVAADPVAHSEYLAQFLRDTGRKPQAIEALEKEIPSDASGEQWYQVAQISRRLGFQNEALTASETAVAKAPDNPIYGELCVKICRATNQYEKAIQHLDATITQLEKPRDIALSLQTRIEILHEGGLLAREEQRLNDRIRENRSPTWQDLWQLGLVYKSQNDNRLAQPLFEKAVQALPDEPTLLATSADVDIVSGNLELGIRKYEQLAELEPHLRSTHYRRVVELYIGQNDRDNARKSAARLFSEPANRAKDFLNRAAVAKLVDDAKTESRMLLRAVQTEPRNVEARVALGQSLAERGERAEAIENFWRAFELVDSVNEKGGLIRTMHDLDEDLFARRIMPRLQSNQDTGASNRETELSLADAYLAAGDLPQASLVLMAILQDDALDPLALQRIANVEMRRNRPLVAADYLEKLAEVSDSATVWRQLLSARETGGLTDECIHAATRLATDYGATAVFSELIDRVPINETKRALAFANAGLELNPADWKLRIRLAVLLENADQRRTALASALNYCLADPKLVESAEKQVELTRSLSTAKPPRNSANAILSHNQIRMVLNSTFPVFQEFNNARANAYRYIRQQQIVNRARQRPQQAASRRSSTGQFIPSDPYNGAIYCHQILAKEYGNSSAKLLANKNGPPEWIQLRIQIVSAAAGEEIWANLDQLEHYAKLRPDDLLPHIAKFYESIRDTDLDEIAAANLRSIEKSYEWLIANHAFLAQELGGQYAQQLVTAKRFAKAAKLLAEQVNKAKSVKALVQMAPTCLQVDSPAFRESFLTRALELANAPDTIPEDVGSVLLVAFNEPLRKYKPTEWVAVLALLENHLKSPVQYGHSRRVTSAATFQSSQAARTQQSQQLATALKDPTLSTDQKRAIAKAIQRRNQVASLALQRRANGRLSRSQSRNGRVSTDKIMTSNNPHLSHHQREILSRAIEQAQNSGDERMVLNWLSKKAAPPNATITQRVAHPYALWLANRREAAADGFAKLSKDIPQDVNLRLLAASAAYEVNSLDRSFVMLSDKSLKGSRVESDTILLQSQVNSSLAKLTDYDVGLRCLIAAMEHQTVPYLYPFFTRQGQRITSTTLPSQGATAADIKNDAWRLSGKPLQSAVILGILDHAWQLDNGLVTRARTTNVQLPASTANLKRIQSLVETNLTLHSNNQELITLEILLMLRNGEYDKAKNRIALLQRSNSADQWTSSTTAELASAMCRIPPTAELGCELASMYIIGNISRGASQRGTELLKSITHAIADRRKFGDQEVGKKFWGTYFQSLEKRCAALPVDERQEVVAESIKAIYEASHDTIPAALTRIADIAKGPLGDQLQPSSLGPILYSTVRNANLHWLNSERRGALDALISLTFPDGLQGRCEMWNWYQFPNAESELLRYSLGDPILRIAAGTQQLDSIRKQLEQSPFSEDPQIVALRLEIAKFNSDVTTLIPLAAATNKRKDIPRPPVWSLDLIDQVDPSLKTIGAVIRRSGKVTLKTGNKTASYGTLDLPSAPFKITGIELAVADVSGQKVRTDRNNPTKSTRRQYVRPLNVANLHLRQLTHLESLELSNVRLSDNDLQNILQHPIVKLRLDGTEITDKGLQQLASIKTLRELSVRRTLVTEAALDELRKSLPNCEVSFSD